MALSEKAKKVLISGLANKAVGTEIASAIDAGGNTQAGAVAAIPASADLTVPAATPAAVVDTDITATQLAVVAADLNDALDLKADNAVMVTVVGEIETRLDTLETKVNAIIAALKAAGLMAP